MTKLDYYFHHSYSFIPNFFFVVNVSYRMSARIKKLFAGPKNLGLQTFQDISGHIGMHLWPVGFCRQCGVEGTEQVTFATRLVLEFVMIFS